MTSRPTITRARVCYFVAGAGLLLVSLALIPIVSLAEQKGWDISQIGLQGITDALYYLPFLALPVALSIRKCGAESLRLGGVSGKTALVSAALGLLCVPVANNLTALWTVLLEALGFTVVPNPLLLRGSYELAPAVLLMGVVPGVCEELLFRGVTLSAYEQSGTKRALIVSSLLFATLHGSVQGFPVQFGIGLMLGLLCLYTDSVYAGMMTHMVYNSALVLLSFLVGETGTDGQSMLEALGGWPALIAVAFSLALQGGALFLVLFRFRVLARRAGMETVPRTRMEKRPLGIVALCAGILLVLLRYALDVAEMLGVGL